MEVLPEIRVILQRIQPGERAVDADYPDNVGQRTKLGGQPDWIQDDETPFCPTCGPMTFVGQIDSIDETYMFGDAGMIYVFYCFDCGATQSVCQFY